MLRPNILSTAHTQYTQNDKLKTETKILPWHMHSNPFVLLAAVAASSLLESDATGFIRLILGRFFFTQKI